MEKADEIILDLVMQHCHVEEKKTVWEIHHNFLSANERATAYLFRKGILKEKRSGAIYSLSKKVKF